jgi:acyl carrier protein
MTRQSSALNNDEYLAKRIRGCIAERAGVDINSISVDSHFRDDLGLDLFDVIELMIMLEEKLTIGESPDEADQIELVGDLIRHFEATVVPQLKRS